MKKKQETIEELIEKYGDLAKQLAWKYWKRLPPSVKLWVDADDLIAEAYLCIVRDIQEKYDPKRSNACTFVYVSINNMLINFCRQHDLLKRRGHTVSVEAALEAEEHGDPALFDPKYLGKEDPKFQRLEAYDALSQTFHQCSPKARKEIHYLFSHSTKRPRHSPSGQQAREEFHRLAVKNKLSKDDCVDLLRSGVCLA